MAGLSLLLLLLLVTIGTNTVLSKGCGQTKYRENSGEILISDYDRSTHCTYEIKLDDRHERWIQLEWESFRVDGDMPYCKDYVKVYTGCQKYTLVATFCSNNLVASVPHKIYSPHGCMMIEVKAVGSTTQSLLGFHAKYTSGTGSISGGDTSCTRQNYMYSGTGVIISPRWPENLNKESFNLYEKSFNLYEKSFDLHEKSCDWTIDLDRDELIQLNFMDVNFDLDDEGCHNKPYISVQGITPKTTTNFPEEKYCTNLKPFTWNTDYYELKIQFEAPSYSSFTKHHRGFAIGFLAYRSTKTGSGSASYIPILAGVVGTVAFIIFIVLLCVVCRRRATSRQKITNISNASYGASGSITANSPQQPHQPQPQPQPHGYQSPPQYTSLFTNPQQQPLLQHSGPEAPPPYPGLLNTPSSKSFVQPSAPPM